ncbi:MAG TPA: enolase C-terminal domain-like protein [Candidatus Cybelea sp.]|nr:enolase C-terminal domain-like protein [Candidatus Cybelea sp.]
MAIMPKLTLRNLRTRAVRVPMRRPLATRVVVLESAPLVLIDLETEEGVTGRAYIFAYLAAAVPLYRHLLATIADALRGQTVAPAQLFDDLRRRLTLIGHQGVSLMAIAGFDMAAWDALAKAADLPLVRLLGGRVEPVLAYNSNGLGLMAPGALKEEAQGLLEGGFTAMKVRVGRPALAEDLAAIRAVRAAVPEHVTLMTDFNQGLDTMEAIRRGRAFDGEGLAWIEEPIVYDDLAGQAKIAAEVATPIQIGENFYGPRAMADAIAAKAADYMMPDLQRIGGVTGWLRAAALAEAAGIPMSSHLFPEFSAHVLTVTPTRHWLEYVDWAAPVLTDPLKVSKGHAVIRETAGAGIAWDEAAVKRYAFD